MARSTFGSMVSFKDTRGCGGITIRGIELQTDEDGFIEGPADIAPEIAPHGFVREERPVKAQPQQARR